MLPLQRNPARNSQRRSQYIATHETVLARFRDQGFVGDDALQFTSIGPYLMTLEGEIGCLGHIVIGVRKIIVVLDDDDDPEVCAAVYAYNVSIRNGHNILRYDNAHPHPGHADEYHKHTFDWRTGAELGLVWIGSHQWPTLGDIIEEVRRWHAERYNELHEPNEYAGDLRSEMR